MNSLATQLDEESAHDVVAAAVSALPPQPTHLHGRGIVIPGGGPRYFPGAWVCIRTLRDVGCTLPIELWHLGEAEVNDEMRELVEPFDVVCVDAEQVAHQHPAQFVAGWPLKPYAMLHSRFREVLLLDADNMPIVDPSFLFDEPEYTRTGAIFWPDKGSIGPARKIWALMGVDYRNESAVEAAQLVVDKAMCWPALALTAWMNNEHADFWYQHIYGDKDTFHLAWRRLGLEYAMPAHAMRPLPMTMVQHDFAGRPIFQHRHWNKWVLDGQMLRIPGFQLEDHCFEHLRELRERWSGHPAQPYRQETADAHTRLVADSLAVGYWRLAAADDESTVRFRLDGGVDGGGPREQTWAVHVHPFESILWITGIDSLAWILVRDHDDRWVGRAPIEPARHVELLRHR